MVDVVLELYFTNSLYWQELLNHKMENCVLSIRWVRLACDDGIGPCLTPRLAPIGRGGNTSHLTARF